MTTTTRVGIHQIEFNHPGEHFVALNLDHGIGPDRRISSFWQKTGENEISGYRQSSGWAKDQIVYFVARFSEDFSLHPNSLDSTKALLSFHPEIKQVIIKVGISAVSEAGALKNLETEANHWDFEEYITGASTLWNKELAKVIADFQSEKDKEVFYTALYHSFLAPNIFSDVDGKYRGMDRQVHSARHNQYTVFSLWDTFRATHPLFTLLNSRANVDMINSMLNMYEQGGLLPVWELAGNETGTMIGYHAIPVITDAIMKDVKGFDYALALKAMVNSANQDHLGLMYYKKMGYIPAEKEHESVSKTLEYAYDDWCIATVAKKLGEDSLYEVFSQRAQSYKNLYNQESGFMRPKRNGNWLVEFDPYEVSGNYTEANAWQYNYFVPHDLKGLKALFSDNSNLENRLDELFTAESKVTGRHQPDIDGMIGQYAHGNEPSHNFAYLYNWTDKPWKTQELVARINRELYDNTPNGLSGNEDCGQMSSWFVFSAMGLYPAVPGTNEYVFGSPMLKKATIQLENGNVFEITANNLNTDNIYIQAIKLNGRTLDRYFITHDEIIAGGTLEFIMTNSPEAIVVKQTPRSSIESTPIATTPIIEGGEMTFLEEKTIQLSSQDSKARIYYTLDNSHPDSSSNFYTGPFVIDSTQTVHTISYESGKLASGIARADFVKIPFGRNITLKNPYSHLYTGNSSMALIDYIHGGANFRDGWQGFHEVDLDAIVDLGKMRQISAVEVGFLQDHYSWIFYPDFLEISFSADGISYSKAIRVMNPISQQADGLITQKLGSTFKPKSARYVRILAKNLGKCPDWHKGAGGKAWLFADEISISTK